MSNQVLLLVACAGEARSYPGGHLDSHWTGGTSGAVGLGPAGNAGLSMELGNR